MTIAIQHVLDIIEQLTTAHNQLLGISKKKSELIKEDKINEFQKLLMQERKQIQHINQLEEKRMQAVGSLFEEMNIAEEEQTVSILLAHMEAGQEKQQMEIATRNLIEQIVAIRHSEQLNKDLIDQSMQFVQLSLEMLQPNFQRMNYSPKATSQSPTGRSVFDSKA